MAACEFHRVYEEFLAGEVAVELIGRGDQYSLDCGEVLGVIKRIDLCRILEQITPGEAENLTSVVFKLYPQFEGNIKTKLAEQFR